jgi:hypothetical protein
MSFLWNSAARHCRGGSRTATLSTPAGFRRAQCHSNDGSQIRGRSIDRECPLQRGSKINKGDPVHEEGFHECAPPSRALRWPRIAAPEIAKGFPFVSRAAAWSVLHHGRLRQRYAEPAGSVPRPKKSRRRAISRAQLQSSTECIARITPPAGPISHTNNSRVGTPVLRHSAPQPQQRPFRAINWVPLGPPYFRDRFERCLAFLARLALVIRSLRRIGADD